MTSKCRSRYEVRCSLLGVVLVYRSLTLFGRAWTASSWLRNHYYFFKNWKKLVKDFENCFARKTTIFLCFVRAHEAYDDDWKERKESKMCSKIAGVVTYIYVLFSLWPPGRTASEGCDHSVHKEPLKSWPKSLEYQKQQDSTPKQNNMWSHDGPSLLPWNSMFHEIYVMRFMKGFYPKIWHNHIIALHLISADFSDIHVKVCSGNKFRHYPNT